MLEKFTKFLEEKISGPMVALSEQRHLQAVRDGIIATLPLIIVGSFFLIIAFPPLPQDWAIYQFLSSNAAKILLPYRMTMYIMTLYATFGIGFSLSKSYKLDGVTGGILSTMALLLTITPQIAEGIGFAMPMANLGGGGMFIGIILSIVSVEIYRLCMKSNFKISMPEQVPSSVARSFEALTPTAIIIILVGSLTYFVGLDWHGIMAGIMAPLVSASDSLPSVIILIFLITLFWSFGIHGVSIIGTLARPLWLVLLENNSAAQAAGETIPHIAAEPFFQWFIWIGGSGCTIGLALLLAFATKSAYGKALGKASVVPAVFNINEPLIFGAPIVLNPTLIIPFIITPIVCGTLSWFAMALNLVNRVVVIAPWTLPGPIGAYIATGGDWRAAVLNIICIVISIVIYYPFVRMYDKQQLDLEKVEA